MNPDQSPPRRASDPMIPEPAALNGLLFISVLVAPVVLTSALVLFGFTTGDLAPLIGFLSGLTAGIVSGIMLANYLGRTLGMKILLGLIFVPVMATVSVGMSCVGCVACGYRLNFH